MKKIILILLLVTTAFSQTPQVKTEDLLRLRNLQYEQAKRLVRMQEIKSEFDRLNSENQRLNAEIETWIKEQAKAQNIDLTKDVFDFDKLKFVERQEKPNE